MASAQVVDFAEYRSATAPCAIGEVAPVVFEADLRICMETVAAENDVLGTPLSPAAGVVRVSVREDDSYTVRLRPSGNLHLIFGGIEGGNAMLEIIRHLLKRE